MALPKPVTPLFFSVDWQFTFSWDFSPRSLRTGLVSAFLELTVARETAVKTQSLTQGDSQTGGGGGAPPWTLYFRPQPAGQGLTGHLSSWDLVLGMGGAMNVCDQGW